MVSYSGNIPPRGNDRQDPLLAAADAFTRRTGISAGKAAVTGLLAAAAIVLGVGFWPQFAPPKPPTQMPQSALATGPKQPVSIGALKNAPVRFAFLHY
ncbi:MAG TPA: hypothetical protein VMV79_08545 [Alphaproteobacteria bacterium]|nr:hypothetical protein [Alphaproteobacteria bacterium]